MEASKQAEKRPTTKSKSLTAAEFLEVITSRDLQSVKTELKNTDLPPSLDEAQKRRASIKQERRDAVTFVRSRTASRVSGSTRPTLADLNIVAPLQHDTQEVTAYHNMVVPPVESAQTADNLILEVSRRSPSRSNSSGTIREESPIAEMPRCFVGGQTGGISREPQDPTDSRYIQVSPDVT